MTNRSLSTMTALFVTCASVLGASATARAQTVAGPYEYNNCAIPEQISFVAEDVNAPWWPSNFKVQRYVKYPGQPMTKMQPAPGRFTAKNADGALAHAPGQIQNCTLSTGKTQWLAFRVRTWNYFSSGIGGHLVFGLRSRFSGGNGQAGNGSYDAIGIIFAGPHFPKRNPGVAGERFLLGTGVSGDVQPDNAPNVTMTDNTTYLVEVHAGTVNIAYRVTDETHGVSTDWVGYWQPADRPEALGNGLSFGDLCNDVDGTGSCEQFNQAPHRVDLWDIASGWM